MNEPVIRIENVSRWYGEVLGVCGVTLQVAPGITGLLGPNGAGKSTLLKLITGQIRASHGRVFVLGEPVWNNFRLNRRLGFCPEHDSFYEEMTGLGFLSYLCRLSGWSHQGARERAAQLLARVGLAYAADRALGKYSKGMRQRAKIAQSLIHDPELLVMDEPLTGADPIARRDLLSIIRSLAAEGRGVIFSSHVLHEVEELTTTVVLMHQGKVIAEGDFREIRELINSQPHRVFLRCDRPRDMAERLLRMPHVSTVEFHEAGDGLTVLTRDARQFYTALPGVVLDLGARVDHVESPDDNLGAIFRYLVRE
ncbi:MAG: ABC transporter ATP-binding protein [Planctomycetes bacterium]|nr:ABC transporter ATP-binding protein [Planctomycetota bacterium]